MKNLKCKVLALCMGASVFMCEKAFSQVPSYVPTNGLVGWWPFNGNANDESGNGNNGIVNNGTLLTLDRNGNNNSAYYFDGINDYISANIGSLTKATFSFWYNSVYPINYYPQLINIDNIEICVLAGNNPLYIQNGIVGCISGYSSTNNASTVNSLPTIPSLNTWHHLTMVYDNSINKHVFYIDGIICSSQGTAINPLDINIGYACFGNTPNGTIGDENAGLKGKMDDIGIWNRALTQQEITALYNSCGNEITTQPTNSLNTIGSNSQFSVNAVASSTYQWQSNPLNTGWLNLTNNSTYSGATTNTLTVSNTTISNHHQPFRAIVNAGGCVDTSNVAQIIIGDTCLTTVTDTLIINTTLGLPAPNNENTILIYPNPASDHITIDNGNYTSMAGYTIKIENNAGQQVFQSLINQAQFYVDLSTWSGNGLYFVHLIDAQGNTVTVRKIVLQ
jgi:hypothetical protein